MHATLFIEPNEAWAGRITFAVAGLDALLERRPPRERVSSPGRNRGFVIDSRPAKKTAMTATVLCMSMSLDVCIAGPEFREAVPISDVRHLATPMGLRLKSSDRSRSPPSPPRNDDALWSWRRDLAQPESKENPRWAKS